MLTSLPQYSHLHCVWILIMLLKDGVIRHCELLTKMMMMKEDNNYDDDDDDDYKR